MKRALPVIRPFLKLMGKDTKAVEAALADAEAAAERMRIIATVPNRFNSLFASRGWIMYDMMNVEVAQTVVEKAETGDVDGAEQDLVEYFSPETVRVQLTLMLGVKAFRPRMELARKAQTDYTEGRYYACVPVVLGLLDGLVNDLTGSHGFFREGANLEAWDSIAGHSSGLSVLAANLGKTRRKTTTDEITIPYRNGILHGVDLGYDNQMVAAKAWAALFATADWARKAESGVVAAPPEEPKLTLRESLQELFRTVTESARAKADFEARMAAWAPRSIVVGRDIPATGEPEAFGEGTPERRLAEFIAFWRAGNYGYMAQCLSFTEKKYSTRPLPAEMREYFGSKQLRSFQILQVKDEAPAITEIKTKLVYSDDGREVERDYNFRLVSEDAAGGPVIRGKPGGVWVIYTYYV